MRDPGPGVAARSIAEPTTSPTLNPMPRPKNVMYERLLPDIKKAASTGCGFRVDRNRQVGADGRIRTGTALATAPSRQRVYQFHHVGGVLISSLRDFRPVVLISG